MYTQQNKTIMNIKLTLLSLLILSTMGCSSNINMSDPETFVAVISDKCQEHAALSVKNGQRHMIAYSDCMQNTLTYIKNQEPAK
jgi:hypothetical protein